MSGGDIVLFTFASGRAFVSLLASTVRLKESESNEDAVCCMFVQKKDGKLQLNIRTCSTEALRTHKNSQQSVHVCSTIHRIDTDITPKQKQLQTFPDEKLSMKAIIPIEASFSV